MKAKKVSLAQEVKKIMKGYKHVKNRYAYTVEDEQTAIEAVAKIENIEGLNLSVVKDIQSKTYQIVNKANANGFVEVCWE